MGIKEDGIKGERLLFNYLRNIKKVKFLLQADAIYELNSELCIAEVKHQEHFVAPPFDGHGLPLWQIKARLKFQNETGIRAVLYVFEKPFDTTHTLYWQYFDVLENGKWFDTHGLQPRRVYKIESFLKETC